jgi:hypothetical protein
MNDFKQHSLRLVKNCPVCQTEYVEGRVEILQELNNAFLAYLTCTNCSTAMMMKVAFLAQGLVGNAVITDLQIDEVLDLINEEKISMDEVLDFHQNIQTGKIYQYINNQ